MEDEYNKVIDKGARTNAQRKRKEELEGEIELLTKNITAMKRTQRKK